MALAAPPVAGFSPAAIQFLADLAVTDAAAFSALVEVARAALPADAAKQNQGATQLDTAV